jgi:hypothetical protein
VAELVRPFDVVPGPEFACQLFFSAAFLFNVTLEQCHEFATLVSGYQRRRD